MMMYDIKSGLQSRERWLPCRSFSLNSLTLSLLAIAAKVPVDLTTPMPSPIDQLSGTSLVVVAMGFVLPSLGEKEGLNNNSNLAALTIFVITVIVNICIQISTGVIVLFIPEHIIISFCMLLLVTRIWIFSHYCHKRSGERPEKKRATDANYVFLRTGKGSLFSGVCLIATITLIQAAVRSLILNQFNFCGGTSDYDWSMKVIVTARMFVVLVGGFASTFRWLTMYPLINRNDQVIHDGNMWMKHDRWFLRFLYLSLVVPLYCLAQIGWYLSKGMTHILGFLLSYTMSFDVFKGRVVHNKEIEEFIDLIQNGEKADTWILQNQVPRMNAMIVTMRGDGEPYNCLVKLLKNPSKDTEAGGIELLSLHLKNQNMHTGIAILVSVAKVSMPDSLSQPLLQSFDELRHLFDWIEEYARYHLSRVEWRYGFGHASKMHEYYRILLPEILNTCADCDDEDQSDVDLEGDDEDEDQPEFDEEGDDKEQSNLDRAIVIITKLSRAYTAYSHRSRSHPYFSRELDIITKLINPSMYSTIDDLYARIEQLFIDMLHAFLESFPHSIFNMLQKEFDESCLQRIEVSLHMMCLVEQLESHIQWSFPEECNISRLINIEPPAIPAANDRAEQRILQLMSMSVVQLKIWKSTWNREKYLGKTVKKGI